MGSTPLRPCEVDMRIAGSSRRSLAVGGSAAAIATLCLIIEACGGKHAAESPTTNPVVRENQQPGSDAWQFWRQGLSIADDATGQIKGYASATSVAHGEALTLFVTVRPPQPYTIDLYRLGWYGGAGGRLVAAIGPLDGSPQAPCPVNAETGLIACDWSPSYELRVPDDWLSGVYIAVLRNEGRFASFVTFVVRDDTRAADLLFQQSVTTYQAYNLYPDDGKTGKSLYPKSYGAKTVSGETRAVAVSFDRPYAGRGDGQLLFWEIHLLRWLERTGYDVIYATDVDTHERGERLRQVKAFLSVGHDEYWSREMRDAVEAARGAGTSLVFAGANEAYWQVRFAPSSHGARYRIMLCAKEATLDPGQGDRTTVRWRDPPVGRAEQALVGIQYGEIIAGGIGGVYAPYVVQNSGHWIYAGTGLADGDTIPGIVGYETDREHAEYPLPATREESRAILSRSPYVSFAGTPATGESAIYQAPSGAWVFAAGTIGWSLGLDDLGDQAHDDSRLQRITANVLDRMIGHRVFSGTARIRDRDAARPAAAAAPLVVRPVTKERTSDIGRSVNQEPAVHADHRPRQ